MVHDQVAAGVGPLLRERRLSNGMTQQELAELAGVSVRTVRYIEQGRIRRPRQASLRQLTAVLGPVDPPPRVSAGQLGIEVLGPLAVHRGGEVVEIGSSRQRSALGLLALHANEVVPQAEVVEALWGQRPPSTYRDLLHSTVSRLRKTLRAGRDPVVVTRGNGYVLEIDPQLLDLTRFTGLAGAAREARGTAEALRAYTSALGCWRGQVLADLPEHLRDHPTAVALHQQRIATTVEYADLAIAATRYGELLPWLQVMVDGEPWHEGLHARLVVALAGAGRQADALAVFHRIRDRLDQDLGLLPGAELALAHESVLRQEIPAQGRGWWAVCVC